MSNTRLHQVLTYILQRAPHPNRLRFGIEHGRGTHVHRMTDHDLKRDAGLCRILTDPDITPPDLMTREQRGRLYDYAHMLRTETARRRDKPARLGPEVRFEPALETR